MRAERPWVRHLDRDDPPVRAGVLVALVLFVALVASACSGGGTPGADGPRGGPLAMPDLVRRTEPAVVTIRTPSGLGSGVVLRDDIVVTNQHVVTNTPVVSLQFADGTSAPGQVLAADAISDIAVVRSARPNLPTLPVRTQLPQQGEAALALGSPLGLENTATSGIVSAVGRELPERAPGTPLGLVQTDAPISPGNSGGALVDGQGRLIGLNEIYLPPKTGAVALGFAIPAATVVDVADQMLTRGTVLHPYLGASLTELSPDVRDQLGVRAPAGAVVADLAPDGPAVRSGVRTGDVVTSFADQPVGSVEDVVTRLARTVPGQQVPLTVARGGAPVRLGLVVGERPPS